MGCQRVAYANRDVLENASEKMSVFQQTVHSPRGS